MSTNWQHFFDNSVKPSGYAENICRVKDFVAEKCKAGLNVVLISSGGTTVPLESKTVRFIDNFSVGTRGSSSAEYFLENGYSVIFLHRRGSLEPYKRHLPSTNVLDYLTVNGGTVCVKEEFSSKFSDVIKRYQLVKEEQRLLSVEFTTLGDYLHLLKGTSEVVSAFGNSIMFYLAAAVSDFYIPSQDMPEHKIQSSEGPLQIHLQLVPKVLRPLVNDWIPDAFVVSFKLETDQSILIPKAKRALDTYKHQIVIGNQLETRKREVYLVTQSEETPIRLTEQEIADGLEIEQKIIPELIKRHELFKNERT